MILAAAFEEDAAEEQRRLEDIWKKGAKQASHENFPQFKMEDLSRESSFKGLDRTKIPATPNYRVNMADGLSIFLRHARRRDPPHPMVGLGPAGPRRGDAMMSYGSGIAMFGDLPAPGRDYEATEESEERQPPRGIVVESAPGPKTERERYEQNAIYPPSEPRLSPEQQWALFDAEKYRDYAGLLVSQYAKLV